MKKIILTVILIFTYSASYGSEEAARYHLKALILQAKNDIAGAEQAFKKATSYKPEIRYIYVDYGNFLYDRGNFEGAAQQFRQAIKIKSSLQSDTHVKVAHSNLGTALLWQGKFKQAEKEFRTAIKYDPDYFDAINNLGEVLRRVKDYKGAEKAFKRASELKPDALNTRINYGVALFFNGKKEQSIKVIEGVLKQEPDNKGAKNALDYVLTN